VRIHSTRDTPPPSRVLTLRGSTAQGGDQTCLNTVLYAHFTSASPTCLVRESRTLECTAAAVHLVLLLPTDAGLPSQLIDTKHSFQSSHPYHAHTSSPHNRSPPDLFARLVARKGLPDIVPRTTHTSTRILLNPGTQLACRRASLHLTVRHDISPPATSVPERKLTMRRSCR